MLKPKMKVALCAAALASLALAPACKKDEASSGGSAAGGGAVSAATGTALSYMPKSSSMVFGVNFESAFNAKVLAKYKDMLLSQAPPEMKEFEATCGMNLQKDIKSITVGMTSEEKAVFVVNGNFTQAKIEECMTKMSEKEGKKMTMADEGKMRVYAPEGEDDKMYVHFPSDGMAVVSMTEMGGKDLLGSVLAGEKLGDGEVMNLVKSTKTSATFWAAGNPEKLAKNAPMDAEGVKGIAMTLNAGDNLDIKLLANMESADLASSKVEEGKKAIAMGKGMAPPNLQGIVDKFKLEADGAAIKAGISLSAADIDAIAATIPMLMGGM